MEKVVVVVRPPPDVSLYHRKSNPLFPQVLTHLGATSRRAGGRAAPHRGPARVRAGRWSCRRSWSPSGRSTPRAWSRSADLVVSAGGTMNREAVALGTPVYTTYGGRLGGVDEALIREHRLRPLTDPRGLELAEEELRRGAAPARSGAAGRHDPRRRRMSAPRTQSRTESRRAIRCRPRRPPKPTRSARRRAESLAERYKQMAHEGHEHRGVDTALRALDLGDRGRRAASCCRRCWARSRSRSALTSGAPVLYRGRRVGRAGRIFTMLKFRTLTPGRRGAARPVPRPRAHRSARRRR